MKEAKIKNKLQETTFKECYQEDYQIWCLEEMFDDALWEIAQKTAEISGVEAKRYFSEFKGVPYFSCNIGGASIANIKNATYIEDGHLESFLQKWGKIPTTCISVDNHGGDFSAKISVEFAKNLQKRYKHVVFDSIEDADLYIFDDDIQKIEFIDSKYD